MMVPYQQDGRWRLLDTAPDRRPGERADGEDVARRFSAKLSAGLGRPVRVGPPSWNSVFTFQQRMVPRMREGRCFVAGDAAHVHSPASGQGMNTGIQEAYNLGWKLAMVDHGQAGQELLATYGLERVPVGRALLGSTRKATFLVQFKNRLAGVGLPVVFTFVRALAPLRRAIQRKVLGGMSGLRLAYPDSPLTTPSGRGPGPVLPAGTRAAAAAARHPDDPGSVALRAELRDTRWSLVWAAAGPGEAVRVARAAAAEHGDWLSVRTAGDGIGGGPAPLSDPDGRLRRSLGLGPGGWVLIRPDGYLAAGGPTLTWRDLERALAPLGRLASVHYLRPRAEARTPAPALQQVSGGSPEVRDTVESTPRVLEGRR